MGIRPASSARHAPEMPEAQCTFHRTEIQIFHLRAAKFQVQTSSELSALQILVGRECLFRGIEIDA